MKTDNELIAEFMGGKIVFEGRGGQRLKFINGLPIGQQTPMSLKYNQSWDWLMPVVEKINTLKVKTIDETTERTKYEQHHTTSLD